MTDADTLSARLRRRAAGTDLPADADTLREAAEALDDVQQIARAGFASSADEAEALAQEEEDERAFVEIVEYVRVVILILREEWRGPRIDDPIH